MTFLQVFWRTFLATAAGIAVLFVLIWLLGQAFLLLSIWTGNDNLAAIVTVTLFLSFVVGLVVAWATVR